MEFLYNFGKIKFKIKSINTPNDYMMIQEVLNRRLKRNDWDYPGLIIIDGGKGQVSAAYRVIKEMEKNIPVIGIAKREERIVIPKIFDSTVFLSEKKYALSTPGINLIRRIRDEAHRFALSYHHHLRRKSAFNID